uniref:TFIIS-type domain-containing protein n=1 Tax=Oryza rufipogon TaxID=4529 RepID=A0A0E0NNH1_ORYRU
MAAPTRKKKKKKIVGGGKKSEIWEGCGWIGGGAGGDTVGIVARLSECIASRGGNIHSVDFTYNPMLWPRDVLRTDFLNLSQHFSAQRSTVRVPDLDPKYKISVLASKQDHCLFDLLYRWQEGRLPVDINCVISNHDRLKDNHVRRFLERHGIPYHYLPTSPGNKREQEILELVQGTDFVVLARYMQILSEGFLKAYGKDIINIHHGLLPSFKGGNPSRQAFNAGVKLIGATSHFVTPELDAGPIIEQMVERVSHRDTLQSFVVKSENLEKQCLAEAIKSYCELRVLPYELKKTAQFEVGPARSIKVGGVEGEKEARPQLINPRNQKEQEQERERLRIGGRGSAAAMSTMKFCRECNNILYPKEEKDRRLLLFACRNCEHQKQQQQEVSESKCVYRNEVAHAAGERTQVLQDVASDPTLPRTKTVRCAACGHGEAVFFQATARGEEGMTLFFVCCNLTCAHRWRE